MFSPEKRRGRSYCIPNRLKEATEQMELRSSQKWIMKAHKETDKMLQVKIPENCEKGAVRKRVPEECWESILGGNQNPPKKMS